MFLTLMNVAMAICTDADGDGYFSDPSCGTAFDCRDLNASINPAAVEDGYDLVDDDCDGRAKIRRVYTSACEALTDFTVASTSVVDGLCRIDAGAGGSFGLAQDFQFRRGRFTVGVDVETIPSTTTCTLVVQSTSMPTQYRTLSEGFQEFDFPAVAPKDTVTRLEIGCVGAAGDEADVDWLTVQNGSYEWAPKADLDLDFSGMGYPGGGRQAFVRLSEDYDGSTGLLLMGSDVGGMAYAAAHHPLYEATEWITANGLATEWNDVELSVSDALATYRGDEGDPGESPSEYTVYALASEGVTAAAGGLWWTTDIAAAEQSWTLADLDADGLGDADLGLFKHRDECDTVEGVDASGVDGGKKETTSGRILIEYPFDPTWLLVASDSVAARGIYLYDTFEFDSAYQPYSNLPDAIPAALAFVELSDTSEWVVIGYRPVMGGTDTNALWVCPADFSPSSTSAPVECAPLTDTLVVEDVRDLEVVAGGDMLLVADGGRRYSGTTGDCDSEDSTAYGVALSPGTTFPTAEIWDTDGTNAEPSWTFDGATTHPYNANCGSAPAATSGDLVAAGSGSQAAAHDLSTIAVDPDLGWAFAFFPMAESAREYGCVRVFRAPLDSLDVDLTLAWEPFQEYRHDDVNFFDLTTATPGAMVRRSHVDARGAFMESEPLLENWAPAATHDAIFVPRPDPLAGNAGADLLVSGNYFWWGFQEGSGLIGWNSDTSEDLDTAEWALAWGSTADGSTGLNTLQSLTSHQAAVCPGCGQVGDTVMGGGSGDYQYALLHGADDPTLREPAQRPARSTWRTPPARWFRPGAILATRTP